MEVSNNSSTDPCAWVGVVDKLGKKVKVCRRVVSVGATGWHLTREIGEAVPSVLPRAAKYRVCPDLVKVILSLRLCLWPLSAGQVPLPRLPRRDDRGACAVAVSCC